MPYTSQQVESMKKLNGLVPLFLKKAERRYGNRDLNFTLIPTINFTNDDPELQRMPDSWSIQIKLHNDCLDDLQKGLFQLGHEIVHVISPSMTLGGSTVLEEGIACYNSLLESSVYNYDSSNKYSSALNGYQRLLDLVGPNWIKNFRNRCCLQIHQIGKQRLFDATGDDILSAELGEKF